MTANRGKRRTEEGMKKSTFVQFVLFDFSTLFFSLTLRMSLSLSLCRRHTKRDVKVVFHILLSPVPPHPLVVLCHRHYTTRPSAKSPARLPAVAIVSPTRDGRFSALSFFICFTFAYY